ncbi:hypothetical protein ACVIGB_000758 [Bradyrhizobium sp. USDA 4341]
MKTVFSCAEDVAAAWAADAQPEGRTPNRKVRFSDGVIRSYGFPMGVLFRAPDGSRFALIDEYRPSQTTAGQISFARAAAEAVGATIVAINDVADFQTIYAKVTKSHLSGLRKRLEKEIATRLADIDRYEPVSWAQASRLKIIASKLRMHQTLAKAFGLNWPPQASLAAFEARANASFEAATRKSELDSLKKGEAWGQRRQHIEREQQEPIAAGEELRLWLRGERVSLQHQPREQHFPRVRFRIQGRRAETDDNRSMSFTEFAKLFRAAVAVVADPQAPIGMRYFHFGYRTYRLQGGGDYHCTNGGRDVIYFDDMMACVEAGAPRLFAQAQRALDPAPVAVAAP